MTAQIQDSFDYEGERCFGLQVYALEDLLTQGAIPSASPEARERFRGETGLAEANPLAPLLLERFGATGPPFRAPHSACWRGYASEWAVRDGTLLLTSFRGWLPAGDAASGSREVDVGYLFPDAGSSPGPVEATWFDGELLLRSERLQHTLQVRAGRVVEIRSELRPFFERHPFPFECACALIVLLGLAGWLAWAALSER